MKLGLANKIENIEAWLASWTQFGWPVAFFAILDGIAARQTLSSGGVGVGRAVWAWGAGVKFAVVIGVHESEWADAFLANSWAALANVTESHACGAEWAQALNKDSEKEFYICI